MKNKAPADWGDYLKVFACTAVMLQPILNLVITNQPTGVQFNLGMLYDLVKYTAPAFIWGILYTTMCKHDQSWQAWPYYRQQWHQLGVPTIWWTLIYLLIMPKLQQHEHYHSVKSFLWQAINGNAAPHLWYNTMMLQFIILMPLFWWIHHWLHAQKQRGWIVTIITTVIYGTWIYFYDVNVLNGPHQHSWYLLDRIFISFIIYGIGGILAWNFFDKVLPWLQQYWLLIIFAWLITWSWTNQQLFFRGFPVNLSRAAYYQPSMTFYSLLVIILVGIIWQSQRSWQTWSSIMHWLANYAYRAYLANVFWQQLLWRYSGIASFRYSHPYITITALWIGTWLLAFGTAAMLHTSWSWTKEKLRRS